MAESKSRIDLLEEHFLRHEAELDGRLDSLERRFRGVDVPTSMLLNDDFPSWSV
jgi:hypothetical protein